MALSEQLAAGGCAAAAHGRAASLRAGKELAFAKKGLAFGALSGLLWAVASVLLLGQGVSRPPFNQPEYWILGPLVAAGVHDFFGAVSNLLLNCYRGQGKEVWRAFASKPGRYCLLGALFGSPLGMGGYLLAVSLAGPAYALPITSLYPAIASVLAFFFLKENISPPAWAGLGFCVIAAFVVTYSSRLPHPPRFFLTVCPLSALPRSAGTPVAVALVRPWPWLRRARRLPLTR